MSDKNIIAEFFRWAKDAQWRLDALPKVKAASADSAETLPVALNIAGAAFRSLLSFRKGEETVAGELGAAFAPDTDLGDLLLIALGDEGALSRFAGRHPQPIYRAKWNSFRREFNEGIRGQGGIALLAARHGAGVLSRGWDTRKRRGPFAKKKPSRMGRTPLEKTVDLGNSPPVFLREPTPLALAEVLSGDAATLGERILRVSIVGSGGWRATSPEEVNTFIRDRGFSPGELALLLREARGFIAECVIHGTGAAYYEMNKAATSYLSGGRTRSEMVRGRRGEELEETLKSEGLSMEDELIEREEEAELRANLEDRLTARERAIIEGLEERKTLKKIAAELGISYGYARNLRSKLGKNIPRP